MESFTSKTILSKSDLEALLKAYDMSIELRFFGFPKTLRVATNKNLYTCSMRIQDLFVYDELVEFFDCQDVDDETREKMDAVISIMKTLGCPSKILGNGASSTVYEIIHEGKRAALKVIEKDEAEIAKIASDHNIGTKVYQIIPDSPTKGSYILICEVMQGTLADPYPWKDAFEVCSQVTYLYQRFNDLGYNHGDVSPCNILWKKYNGRIVCKLSDFGISDQNVSPMSATLRYFFTVVGLWNNRDGGIKKETVIVILDFLKVVPSQPFSIKELQDFAKSWE